MSPLGLPDAPALKSRHELNLEAIPAVDLTSPPRNKQTSRQRHHQEQSVKMARRPARCYRYCKNKVSTSALQTLMENWDAFLEQNGQEG